MHWGTSMDQCEKTPGAQGLNRENNFLPWPRRSPRIAQHPSLSSKLPPPSSPPLPSHPLSGSAMAQPAFLSSLRSRLRSAPPPTPHHRLQPSRGYHVELGAREKALLEEDVALKRFKSYKNGVKQVSKIGNVLTLAVVLACSYEIAVVATSTK